MLLNLSVMPPLLSVSTIIGLEAAPVIGALSIVNAATLLVTVTPLPLTVIPLIPQLPLH